MAQNVTIAGASYQNVPAIEVPKTGGGTASFMDTSDANATASDILTGKTAYVNGQKVTGTGSGGGGGLIEVATSAEMDAKLIDANLNQIYKYTGTSTSKYINSRLYLVSYPTKGDILSMDLGNGSNQYRILKMNGTVAEVLAMYDYTTCAYNASSRTTTIGSITCQKYQDSDLDTTLNTTFYNSLSSEARAAIQSTAITQDAWYYDNTGDPDYSGTYGASVPGTSSYTISKYTGGSVSVGNRYIYALGVQDVIDYLSDEAMRVDASAILRNQNIWKMFYNTESYPGTQTKPWLRSAYAKGSSVAYVVFTYGGGFDTSDYARNNVVRPAFHIDLSLINYTIVS